jgi:acyl carrier protein
MDQAVTADALTERVAAIIAGMKQIPIETIGADTPFRELGMDSLDGINMIYEIELAYDVSISNEEAAEIGSVRELVAKLQTLLADPAS